MYAIATNLVVLTARTNSRIGLGLLVYEKIQDCFVSTDSKPTLIVGYNAFQTLNSPP